MLHDNQNRNKLFEGRNWGIGFAICKKEGEDFTTIQPISPCKDYLNDAVYSEQTGKPFSAYGLSTKKEGAFSDRAYVALGVMPYNRSDRKHPTHEQLESALLSPEPAFLSFLRPFEDGLGISPTLAKREASNRIVASLDLKWVEFPYMISLWSLLLRVGLKYKEGDAMEFLRKVSDDDAYNVRNIIPKLERMMKGERPKQDLSISYDVHNQGIVGVSFPP